MRSTDGVSCDVYVVLAIYLWVDDGNYHMLISPCRINILKFQSFGV